MYQKERVKGEFSREFSKTIHDNSNKTHFGYFVIFLRKKNEEFILWNFKRTTCSYYD